MELKTEVVGCESDFFTTFGYTSVRVLGRGMMGDVVLAKPLEDASHREMVALKTFTRKTPDGGERNRQLFSFEVSILQSIRHANIIGDIRAFQCPGEYTLCMPYYKEGSLLKHLPTVTRELAVKYLQQLASAVSYLHSHRLVHRDIKPDNILISDDGNAILSDFGLACGVPANPLSRVWHCGTRSYKAPELTDFTHRLINAYKCDMYSLGVVLWNMIFQRSKASGGMDYLAFLRAQKHIPAFYRNVIENLLHKDYNARWDSNKLLLSLSVNFSV